MLYFSIERQVTVEIKNLDNTSITVPAFMTSTTPDGQEVIPVFLSGFQGAAYLVGPEIFI